VKFIVEFGCEAREEAEMGDFGANIGEIEENSTVIFSRVLNIDFEGDERIEELGTRVEVFEESGKLEKVLISDEDVKGLEAVRKVFFDYRKIEILCFAVKDFVVCDEFLWGDGLGDR